MSVNGGRPVRYLLDHWDEETARQAWRDACALAEEMSQPWMWEWVTQRFPELRTELEESFDDLNDALKGHDPTGLNDALRRFQVVVFNAMWVYSFALEGRPCPGYRLRVTPKAKALLEAEARTQARCSPQTEEAMA